MMIYQPLLLIVCGTPDTDMDQITNLKTLKTKNWISYWGKKTPQKQLIQQQKNFVPTIMLYV